MMPKWDFRIFHLWLVHLSIDVSHVRCVCSRNSQRRWQQHSSRHFQPYGSVQGQSRPGIWTYHVLTLDVASGSCPKVGLWDAELLVRGERLLNWLDATFARTKAGQSEPVPPPADDALPLGQFATPAPPPEIPGLEFIRPGNGWEMVDLFGVSRAPVPYEVFRLRLAEQNRNAEVSAACAN